MKFLLIGLLISSTAWAAPAKKVSRWGQLMGLINQEMRVLESAKRKDAGLKYRLLELHSEKLKLVHEKNNVEFMEKSKTQNISKNKESFFAETRAYYLKTKEMGLKLMKEHPQSGIRAQVLFAMALNSRDYGKDQITEKYLLETISMIQDPHHSLRHHAETALADFYYNEKRFEDAVTYYQRAIKKTEDEWLTKHLYNLSWCYLKTRNFDAAIDTIKASYFKSKDAAYVDIRDQVLDNVGSFYVYAGRPLDGLDFYLENEKDPLPYLMPMAIKAMDKGHAKETEVILGKAQKLIDKNNWFQHQEQLFHTYLEFYRHYNRFEDHEKTSRELTAYYIAAEKAPKLKLPVQMKEDAIEKMRSLAGFLQVRLAKDMKESRPDYKEDELRVVLNFFNHLITLDSAKKVEYLYFRAETHFSVRRFEDAAPSYVEAVTEARRVKHNELARKSLNSLLALTAMEVLPAEVNKSFLIFAYSEHVSLWPRDTKSEQIYPKLFAIHHEEKSDEKATMVLRVFNKSYPEHLKEQQKLMTKVLDQFIEQENSEKLANSIELMKKGFLAFDKETIQKSEIVLGNILFMKYQNLAKNGERLAAAKGFESIYVHKLYPDKVKYEAAFFAAMAHLELGNTVKSYHWQELAHARMNEDEKLARRKDQLKIAERMYRMQDFVTTFKLSRFLLDKYCHLKDDTQKRLFEISVMTALVEDRPDDAEVITSQFGKCLSKDGIKDDALAQIYSHHEKQGDFHALRRFVRRNSVTPYVDQYRMTLQKWFWEKSNVDLKAQLRLEFKALGHTDTNNWLKEIDLFECAQVAREELMSTVIWGQHAFDGAAYNRALEVYLLKLRSFRDNYQGLMQSDQVDLAILATRIFGEVYHHAGATIQGQRPQGMDAATLKDFSAAMKGVSKQFLEASAQFEKQLNKQLKDKETLTWGSRSIASAEKVENPVFSFFTGLTMDKSRGE
jgi:tetratricopeptide (TPR) repeat protein